MAEDLKNEERKSEIEIKREKEREMNNMFGIENERIAEYFVTITQRSHIFINKKKQCLFLFCN